MIGGQPLSRTGRWAWVARAAAILTVSVSCGPSLSGLQATGPRDLHCTQDAVQWARVGNAYRATGCGREAYYLKVCRVARGCDYENILGGLRNRAAFALECTPNVLQLHYLDGVSYGISGCGKRMTYTYACVSEGDGGTWACNWQQEGAPTQ